MCEYDNTCNSWESCNTTSTDAIAWLDGDVVREYENIEVGTELEEKLKTGLQALVDVGVMVGCTLDAKIEIVNHLECGRCDEEELWRSK